MLRQHEIVAAAEERLAGQRPPRRPAPLDAAPRALFPAIEFRLHLRVADHTDDLRQPVIQREVLAAGARRGAVEFLIVGLALEAMAMLAARVFERDLVDGRRRHRRKPLVVGDRFDVLAGELITARERGDDVRILGRKLLRALQRVETLDDSILLEQHGPQTDPGVDVARILEHDAVIHGLGQVRVTHAGVHVGDPQARDVLVGIGCHHLLEGGQRLGVASLLRQLNRGG